MFCWRFKFMFNLSVSASRDIDLINILRFGIRVGQLPVNKLFSAVRRPLIGMNRQGWHRNPIYDWWHFIDEELPMRPQLA